MGEIEKKIEYHPREHKMYTREEWAEFIEGEYQSHLNMMGKELPKLCFFCLYTVVDLENGNLDVQCEPKVAIKGLHALHGCPFIVRYLSYFHGSH